MILLRKTHCKSRWLRGLDLNQRPSGYEPDELPDCSTPRHKKYGAAYIILSGDASGRFIRSRFIRVSVRHVLGGVVSTRSLVSVLQGVVCQRAVMRR